jgi:ATP-dependent helicase/nuclease subunit A
MAGEQERDLEEHMRLLYVALTRAADKLVVSGVRPKDRKDGSDPRPKNCWHAIVEQAMTSLRSQGGTDHVALVYGSMGSAPALHPEMRAPPTPAMIPLWARRPAPPEARPPRPLSPSLIAVDEESAPPPTAAMRDAALRGTWIHQLLERLPQLPAEKRKEAADSWLERSAGLRDLGIRSDIVQTACAILCDPRYEEFFGPDSLAEAPLAATLSDGRVIAGTVDRLRIGDDHVSIVDFKTGRVPADVSDIPKAHRAQMAAYVDALKVIFPARRISAALLYTAGPQLYEVSS